MDDYVDITIPNWDKYNPRSDVTNSSWLRINHDLFDRPDMFTMSPSEIAVWVFILCLRSKQTASTVRLRYAHASSTGRFKKPIVLSALRKLAENQMIEILPRNVDGPPASITLRDVTKRNDTLRDEEELQGGAKRTAPAADHKRPKSKPKSKADEPTTIARVREAFLDAFRREFGKEYPGWGAPENGKVAQWLKSVPLEKALEYCRFYPKWNDPWVTREGHPFGILVTKYVQLDAFLTRMPQLTSKIAAGRAVERVAGEKEQRLAEMNAHAQRTTTRLSESPALGPDQQSGGILPPSAEVRVPHKLREAPDDQAPFAFADRKTYASSG